MKTSSMSLCAAVAALVAVAMSNSIAVAEVAQVSQCAAPDQGLGVGRVVDIDTTGGPIYGGMTKFSRQDSFLGAKEVVLTFDDGPSPANTRSVLDTLDTFCTKATFFSVGKMAVAYPSTLREVLARGHTVGSHTWSHPMHLRKMKPEAAREEIERGFAAVAAAAGQPIAPFFRFPGLADNQQLLSYLQSRGIGTFTVDVVSNDSFISSPERLIKTTLERVEQHQGGIILFHDLKPQTAKALPVILGELKARGYKVVHLRSRHGFEPDPFQMSAVKPMVARTHVAVEAVAGSIQLRGSAAGGARIPVTLLSPPARPITLAAGHGVASEVRNAVVYGGWHTTVRRSKPAHTVTN